MPETRSEKLRRAHTPHRPIRVADDLWDAFGELAGARNRAEVIREFIRWYTWQPGTKSPRRPPKPEGD